MIRVLAVLLFAASSFAAHAQSFDGRYEGSLVLTRGGGDCGDKTQKFSAEIKGATIRISSALSNKSFEGKIGADDQFFASSNVAFRGRNVTLEWRGQILSTRSGLGSMLIKSEGLCQFLLSIKQT